MEALLEHDAKKLIAESGIRIPGGVVIPGNRPEQAVKKFSADWKDGAYIKAQVTTGSRFKKGWIRRVPAEARAAAGRTAQAVLKKLGNGRTAPLLIEESIPHTAERYLAVVSDPVSRGPLLVFGPKGGVDVENMLGSGRARIRTLGLPVSADPDRSKLAQFFQKGGVAAVRTQEYADTAVRLYQVYRRWHCRMVEVNPLAETARGLVALDAKIVLDEDAHALVETGLAERGVTVQESKLSRAELDAAQIDAHDHRGSAHFVQVDPDAARKQYGRKIRAFIGFNGIGTGASLTAMDELVRLGFFPRNFCATSGNPPASKLYRVTRIIFGQPDIRGYFFISCVSSQQLDHTARGIIKALKELFPKTQGVPPMPALLVFRGAWDADALELFREHGLADRPYLKLMGRDTTEREAARVFAELYKKFYDGQKSKKRQKKRA